MPRLSQRLDPPRRKAYRPPAASRLSATPLKRPVPKRPSPRHTTRPRRSRRTRKALLAGGSMAFLAALAVVPAKLKPSETAVAPQSICQEVVRSESRLSREQLSRLLAIPQASSKEAVHRVVDTPYCILKSAETVRHEAYPLEFDPNTWLVLIYEDEAYNGYDFVFK